MKPTTSLKKIYFLVATLFGLLGTVMAGGIAIHQIIMINRISNEEYLSNNYYRYQCDTQIKEDGTTTARTTEEKETCIAEEKGKALAQRSYNSKENIIGGITRGIIFLIIFAIHARIFFRKEQ